MLVRRVGFVCSISMVAACASDDVAEAPAFACVEEAELRLVLGLSGGKYVIARDRDGDEYIDQAEMAWHDMPPRPDREHDGWLGAAFASHDSDHVMLTNEAGLYGKWPDGLGWRWVEDMCGGCERIVSPAEIDYELRAYVLAERGDELVLVEWDGRDGREVWSSDPPILPDFPQLAVTGRTAYVGVRVELDFGWGWVAYRVEIPTGDTSEFTRVGEFEIEGWFAPRRLAARRDTGLALVGHSLGLFCTDPVLGCDEQATYDELVYGWYDNGTDGAGVAFWNHSLVWEHRNERGGSPPHGSIYITEWPDWESREVLDSRGLFYSAEVDPYRVYDIGGPPDACPSPR